MANGIAQPRMPGGKHVAPPPGQKVSTDHEKPAFDLSGMAPTYCVMKAEQVDQAEFARFLRRLAEFMSGSRIPDLNSGLRAQRRDATIRFLPILPTSHSWVSTITLAYLSSGYLVRWLPIDYFPRVGRSTFHPLRDTYNYLSLIVRAVMYFNPLKVFLPLALALVAAGAAKYVLYDILWRFGPSWPVPSMPGTTLALLFTGLQLGVVGLLADLIVRRTRL